MIAQPADLMAQQKGQQQKGLLPSTKHDYYICISGVNTRSDVEKIESGIQKKSGVTYFLAKGYPARYFRLQSPNSITQQEFTSWLNNNSYKVEYFGEGTYGKEKAIVTGKKLKKLQ